MHTGLYYTWHVMIWILGALSHTNLVIRGASGLHTIAYCGIQSHTIAYLFSSKEMPVGCRNSGTSTRAKSSTHSVGPCLSYLHSFQMKKLPDILIISKWLIFGGLIWRKSPFTIRLELLSSLTWSHMHSLRHGMDYALRVTAKSYLSSTSATDPCR